MHKYQMRLSTVWTVDQALRRMVRLQRLGLQVWTRRYPGGYVIVSVGQSWRWSWWRRCWQTCQATMRSSADAK